MTKIKETINRWSANKSSSKQLKIIYFISFLFLLFTWVEFRFFDFSESLDSGLFFFGLVNFNIILLLFLGFFLFKNIVRIFSQEQKGLSGKSLKAKLTVAFVGFSILPTVLMFLVSLFYINNSFQKYFTPKFLSALESAQEITADYIVSTKRRGYHFADSILDNIEKAKTLSEVKRVLKKERTRFNLDALEFYKDSFSERQASFKNKKVIDDFLKPSVKFKERALKQRVNHSELVNGSNGTLIRLIVPVNFRDTNSSAIVISSLVPFVVTSQQDTIAVAYNNIRNQDSLAYPVKVIYIIILFLIALVIILCATWFGLYLADQLSVPLERLSLAAQQVAKGDYSRVEVPSNSPEITALVSDFNKMSGDLEQSQILLASAQRAAAWREVAKRIAHEIKNPLTPIRVSAERLQKKFGEKVEDKAFLQCTSMIINEVDGLKDLVNEFSLFARLPEIELKKGDINKMIREALVLFDQSDSKIQIQFKADKKIPEFLFDYQQIRRAVANLVDNALAAQTKKGICVWIETSLQKSKRIQIVIEDNGVGASPDMYDRLFEPYVTTKKGGTGLGLAIVRRTFEEHNGKINVYRGKTQGLKFIAELPLILENKESFKE